MSQFNSVYRLSQKKNILIKKHAIRKPKQLSLKIFSITNCLIDCSVDGLVSHFTRKLWGFWICINLKRQWTLTNKLKFIYVLCALFMRYILHALTNFCYQTVLHYISYSSHASLIGKISCNAEWISSLVYEVLHTLTFSCYQTVLLYISYRTHASLIGTM